MTEHPDKNMFDGHLEKPFEEMTPKERLDWLWQVIELRAAAKRVDDEPSEGERGTAGEDNSRQGDSSGSEPYHRDPKTI